MSRINLRVPPDLSKTINDLQKNSFFQEISHSARSSISLKIPNRSLINISEIIADPSSPGNQKLSKKSPKKKKNPFAKSKSAFKSIHTQFKKTAFIP